MLWAFHYKLKWTAPPPPPSIGIATAFFSSVSILFIKSCSMNPMSICTIIFSYVPHHHNQGRSKNCFQNQLVMLWSAACFNDEEID